MAEKISGIYRIVCIKNGRYYYGSSKNIAGRWYTHQSRLRKKEHHNSIMQNAWNKHGEQSFRVEIVEHVSEEKLIEVEQKYLNEYFGKPNCMNVAKDASASARGITRTTEQRKKISEALKGKSPSPETRRKISESLKGGKHSAERSKKISESLKGRKHSAEHCKKISDSMTIYHSLR